MVTNPYMEMSFTNIITKGKAAEKKEEKGTEKKREVSVPRLAYLQHENSVMAAFVSFPNLSCFESSKPPSSSQHLFSIQLSKVGH